MPPVASTEPTVNSNPHYEIVGDADQDREAWLEARHTLVTASDVPKILGIVPGAPALWYEKAGQLDARKSSNEAMTMGHDSESFNAETLYVKKTGRKVKRVQKLLRSKRYPWFGATLDYQIVRFPKKGYLVQYGGDDDSAREWEGTDWDLPAPLELKSTGNKSLWSDGEEPALKFQVQLQGQIVVTGASWGSLSAIIGQPYLHHRWIDYPKHDALCTMIVEETQRFMESLKAGTPPVDDTESNARALRKLDADLIRNECVALPQEAIVWYRRWEEAKRVKAEAERTEKLYHNLLGTAIGLADEAELPDGSARLTFRMVERSGYTVAASKSRQLKKGNGDGK